MAAYDKRMNKHPRQQEWTEKAKGAMQEKAQSGILPGCAPVGYRNVNRFGEKYIEPDPNTCWQVRALFRFIADGLSLRKAGLHAYGLGLRSRNGKMLGPSALYAIATNPFYVGMLRYKGELIEGCHEAVVSRKLFEAAQRNLKDR
ncbi:MAG: recombinase family protein [Abitibacteriaceae bacterium]|nr:recombinase family protein [Abditibacteriaceae bacterium]